MLQRVKPYLIAGLWALASLNCSKGGSGPAITPPLPPAEEPSEDDPGAYAPDAGPGRTGEPRPGESTPQ
jgi:hypothetical protein